MNLHEDHKLTIKMHSGETMRMKMEGRQLRMMKLWNVMKYTK